MKTFRMSSSPCRFPSWAYLECAVVTYMQSFVQQLQRCRGPSLRKTLFPLWSKMLYGKKQDTSSLALSALSKTEDSRFQLFFFSGILKIAFSVRIPNGLQSICWLLVMGILTEKAILIEDTTVKIKKEIVGNAHLHFYSAHRWILWAEWIGVLFLTTQQLTAQGNNIFPEWGL